MNNSYFTAGSENIWIYLLVFVIWMFSAVAEARKKKRKAELEAQRRAEVGARERALPDFQGQYQGQESEKTLSEAEDEVRTAPSRSLPTGSLGELSVKDMLKEYLGLPPEEAESEQPLSEHTQAAYEQTETQTEHQGQQSEHETSMGEHQVTTYEIDRSRGDRVRGLLQSQSKPAWSSAPPTTENIFNLRQAVLASEILGRPKSQRRRY